MKILHTLHPGEVILSLWTFSTACDIPEVFTIRSLMEQPMNSETKMMNIEIQFVGQGNSIIKVREVGKQLWDDIGIKDYHPPCGYDFQELKEVGEGIHEVKVQPNR